MIVFCDASNNFLFMVFAFFRKSNYSMDNFDTDNTIDMACIIKNFQDQINVEV